MKIKKALPLLAMLTAGSVLCLSGCSVDVTTINEDEVPIEEAVEEEDLAEGTVLLHSVWYDADGDILPDAEVAFYEDDSLAFSGTTEEDGSLEAFSLPCNTTLSCSVTDEYGNLIAESDAVIKLSDNYDAPTVYPAREVETEEETPILILEIPTDNADLRAAFYVTRSETVSIANLTTYAGEEAEAADEEEDEEEAKSADEEETKEAAEEQNAEAQNAEEQNTED